MVDPAEYETHLIGDIIFYECRLCGCYVTKTEGHDTMHMVIAHLLDAVELLCD